ncbi:hypothetical protein LY76DRAFT_202922 [Colletotrichum caudatum]|nr:hypothetical protein LY76DRAFT_202922 [Colletotrichum caudatum]
MHVDSQRCHCCGLPTASRDGPNACILGSINGFDAPPAIASRLGTMSPARQILYLLSRLGYGLMLGNSVGIITFRSDGCLDESFDLWEGGPFTGSQSPAEDVQEDPALDPKWGQRDTKLCSGFQRSASINYIRSRVYLRAQIWSWCAEELEMYILLPSLYFLLD